MRSHGRHRALSDSPVQEGHSIRCCKGRRIARDKAVIIGVKEVDVVIRGVGAGRESALRGFAGKGIEISRIADDTPIPHNGPRPPKPRRNLIFCNSFSIICLSSNQI